MSISKRNFLKGAGALAVLAIQSPARAQTYPVRPVTVVVPSAPAGTTDITARLVSEYLSQSMGQQFIVENVSGASGNIGNSRVARASPDGYTLLMSYSGYHVANPHLFKNITWDPATSFEPIGLAGKAPHVIMAAKKLPVKNLAEFIAYAKANPKKLSYASSGIGSIQHIGGEQLKQVAGIDMVHVPYRGAGPAMNDLLAGNVDIFITTPPTAVGQLAAGTVTGLALAGPTRHPLLPELPTTAEAGLKDYELVAWFGLFGPKGLEPAARDRLVAALEAVVKRPEFVSRMEQQGAYAVHLGPPQLAGLVREELAYWGKVIQAAGIKID
jgi:tripartite-type tricarboxylate transporter receptor subunit TctC